MTHIGNFPFGQPVRKVVQTERTPKSVFVLGVYASAVHARWTGTDGRTIVKALAVASEPEIFWRGEGAEEIIEKISIAPELGKLSPADPQFNGPSGIALDELIMNPLGLDRSDAWLCDLVPHSCVNAAQQAAIQRTYRMIDREFNLPEPNVPRTPAHLSDETRRSEILSELQESRAKVLILLGDQPIQWFLRFFDPHWSKLRDFSTDEKTYARLHPVWIDGVEINVLPVVHPRQAGRLGRSSFAWYALHQKWLGKAAGEILHTTI